MVPRQSLGSHRSLVPLRARGACAAAARERVIRLVADYLGEPATRDDSWKSPAEFSRPRKAYAGAKPAGKPTASKPAAKRSNRWD